MELYNIFTKMKLGKPPIQPLPKKDPKKGSQHILKPKNPGSNTN